MNPARIYTLVRISGGNDVAGSMLGGGSGTSDVIVDLPSELNRRVTWTDLEVSRSGLIVRDVPLVTVGGGIGSFALIDSLRIGGVSVAAVAAVGTDECPWDSITRLARASQLGDDDRLRSDSSSTPGNIWGFPSYALREAWKRRSLAPVVNVLTEPIITDFWTPRLSQVMDEMRREADRINWWAVFDRGRVELIRERDEGGYFILVRRCDTDTRVVYRSRWVHVAVGYSAIRMLPDLQSYRERTGDAERVVNAYESHDHVYESLARRPGSVLVRGSGVVASRILERLIDDRDEKGLDTRVHHLFRTYVGGSRGPSIMLRRPGADGWANQAFNWPKSCWGGELKQRLERLDPEGRMELLGVLGGTTTPPRKSWQDQLVRAREGGWYQELIGTVVDVRPSGDGRVSTNIIDHDGAKSELVSDFVIDCTGLEPAIESHPLFADMLAHAGIERNPLGRLDVTESFEVLGARSGDGRIYASGAATLGGPYAAVDSFQGLQYAALRIADDLAEQGFGHRIGVRRSLRQWVRWVRDRPPEPAGRNEAVAP